MDIVNKLIAASLGFIVIMVDALAIMLLWNLVLGRDWFPFYILTYGDALALVLLVRFLLPTRKGS